MERTRPSKGSAGTSQVNDFRQKRAKDKQYPRRLNMGRPNTVYTSTNPSGVCKASMVFKAASGEGWSEGFWFLPSSATVASAASTLSSVIPARMALSQNDVILLGVRVSNPAFPRQAI